MQTKIVTTRDAWSGAHFELRANVLRETEHGFGSGLFTVTTCDHEPLEATDPGVSILHRGDSGES